MPNGLRIVEEGVSQVTATNSVELGAEVLVGTDAYVYVYNAGNSQISKGKGVTVSAVSGYSVSVSSVSGDLLIGVCKHSTIATGYYGWVVKRGFVDGVTNAMASTAIVAGDVVQLGVDGGFAKGVTGGVNVGKAMTATGSAGAFNLYVSVY